uniref:Putative NAD(P)H-dependent oxidoreductase 1 n=1 Tax=Anthurium amnicola TaxID=1678845 RepID=A0A1D1ZA43_9ARAE
MAGIPVVAVEANCRPMPLVGMGTAAYPLAPSDTIRSAVLHAIRVGYRHFDTAALYQSEQPLGEAASEALHQGLIKSRDEVFVTTKLSCRDAHPGLVVPALKNSLRNLGMEYVDLYLVHFPLSAKPGKNELFFKKDELMSTFDMASVWEGMEQCRDLGLAKAIGVSNFSCKKLEQLLETAKIPPAVNQVEMNPMWQQKKLREFCVAKGIHVSAFSPLGGCGTPWGGDQVMGNNILKEIADAKGKTTAQVCLRWVYEQNVSVVVKSFNENRIKENLDILEWELNEEERHKISLIPQRRSVLADIFCSSDGPYRSLEDLWDGEI